MRILALALLLASCGREPVQAPSKREDQRPDAVRATPNRKEEPAESASFSTSGSGVSPRWTERTLIRIAGLQSDDGSWTGSPRTTGFALLAFLSCGETHKHGRYREVVRSGLAWLRARQSDDGRFGEGMDHAVATAAMVGAYALTASPLFKGPAQRAVDALFADRAADIDPDGLTGEERTRWWALVLSSAQSARFDVADDVEERLLRRGRRATDPALRAYVHLWWGEKADAAPDLEVVRTAGPIFDRPYSTLFGTMAVSRGDREAYTEWWRRHHRDVRPELGRIRPATVAEVEPAALWMMADIRKHLHCIRLFVRARQGD